jgi:murein DD-endopeptidase MepM/ murein hydrolase activator NlpD
MGDTIPNIALDNKLGVDEFLVVNPEITNENSLLYIGQKVKINPVSPIINVIVEEEIVEDVVVKYTTKIKYDSSKSYGYREITQQGTDGLQRVTQKVRTQNGHILTIVISDAKILEPTIDKVEIRGTYSVNDPIITGDTDWIWPTTKPYTISSYYGWRTITVDGIRMTSFHAAIDIYTKNGKNSPIYASNSGNIYDVGWYPGSSGNQVIINHNNGYYTLYAHLSKVYVKTGQLVNTGDIIGLMGSTGRSTGTHLHFGLYGCNTCSTKTIPWSATVNPLTLFR